MNQKPTNKWANGLNKQLSKEVQIFNKYMKNCSTFLAIKEIQIKMHWDFTSLQWEWLSSLTHITTNAGDNMGKRNTHIIDGNANCCNYYEK
jgi:hypothetical protein